MPEPYIHLHPQDNVLIALRDLEAGQSISFGGRDFVLRQAVPARQKFTIADLDAGDAVFMYGIIVGKASRSIRKAEIITPENLSNAQEEYSAGNQDYHWKSPDVEAWESRTFEGYHRADGRVGTANYWLVFPLVFCENRNIDVIRSTLEVSLGYPAEKDFVFDIDPLIRSYNEGADAETLLDCRISRPSEDVRRDRVFRNIDGIKFLTHDGGCGGTKEDSTALISLLAGYVTHSNVAGATILSLGCQHAQIKSMQEAIRGIDPAFSKPLVFLEQQGSRSEEEFISQAVKKTFVGLIEANKFERKPAPLSKLTLGLECGGSDGFSGLSANPALGYVSDMLVSLGGISILTEFPELNGVEQELLNRCANSELAEKFTTLMDNYSKSAHAAGSGFASNPSPGNIREGLITNSMKAAGAAKKGGASTVTDVLDYTEQAVNPGLNLLCTPGNDVESTTGLAGSGANIIVFTTGLGTPTGNPVCPVIKVSSNTELHERMNDIIDFDAGSIIKGEDTIDSLAEKLLDYIIEVASGRIIPAAVRLGQDDFIFWKRGISL